MLQGVKELHFDYFARTDNVNGEVDRRGVPVDNEGGDVGLSTSHISPLHLSHLPVGFKQEAGSNTTVIASPNDTLTQFTVNDGGGKATFWAGASLVKVQRPPKNQLLSVTGKGIGGQRSYISGFSGSSRMRLMRLLASLMRTCIPIFITLTYPGVWSDNPKEWKTHLDRFEKSVMRKFPGSALVWKLEAQKRGAPHFHCLLYNVYTIDVGFRGWLSETWYRVVGSNDERHLMAGTRVEYLRSYRGAMAYAAKYMSKTTEENLPEEWGRPGRFWGVYGRSNLPVGEVFEVPLTWLESVTLQRWLRNYAKLPGRDRRTETIFVNSSEDWVRALDGLPSIRASGADGECTHSPSSEASLYSKFFTRSRL